MMFKYLSMNVLLMIPALVCICCAFYMALNGVDDDWGWFLFVAVLVSNIYEEKDEKKDWIDDSYVDSNISQEDLDAILSELQKEPVANKRSVESHILAKKLFKEEG